MLPGLATRWLLGSGCQASFPLEDASGHRWQDQLVVFLGRGVGGVGIAVVRVLVPAVGLLGVKVGDDAGGRARIFGLADAWLLAPALGSQTAGGLGGRQVPGKEAEKKQEPS